MIVSVDLVNVALALATLTYYVGVLLLAVPVPSKWAKRWGARLISDGFASAVLAFSLSTLFAAADAVRDMLGGSISEAFYALTGKYFEFSGLMLLAKFAGTVLSPFTFGIASAIAGVAVTLFSMLASAVATLITFFSMVYAARDVLAALGLALYAVPFRVGRSAGAALIAFSLVGSVLLPLFPKWMEFVDSVVAPPGMTKHSLEDSNYVYFAACLRPEFGVARHHVVVLEDGTTTWFVTSEAGCFAASRPAGGVPPGTYRISVSYLGIGFKPEKRFITLPDDLEPLPFQGSVDYYVEIRLPRAIAGRNIAAYYEGCDEPVSVTDTGTSLALHCSTATRLTVLIGMPRDCAGNVTVEGSYRNATRIAREFTWNGVDVKAWAIHVYDARNVTVRASLSTAHCSFKPSVPGAKEPESYKYTLERLVDLLLYGAMYFAKNMVGVLTFIGLMVMLTYGVAKALGASYVRFPFPV